MCEDKKASSKEHSRIVSLLTTCVLFHFMFGRRSLHPTLEELDPELEKSARANRSSSRTPHLGEQSTPMDNETNNNGQGLFGQNNNGQVPIMGGGQQAPLGNNNNNWQVYPPHR